MVGRPDPAGRYSNAAFGGGVVRSGSRMFSYSVRATGASTRFSTNPATRTKKRTIPHKISNSSPILMSRLLFRTFSPLTATCPPSIFSCATVRVLAKRVKYSHLSMRWASTAYFFFSAAKAANGELISIGSAFVSVFRFLNFG